MGHRAFIVLLYIRVMPEASGSFPNQMLPKSFKPRTDRLRELVRTTVILTSGASVPGVVHHAPCLGSAGSPTVPQNRVLDSTNRYLRFRVIRKVRKHCRCLIFFVTIDEHRWTIVQNAPSARPPSFPPSDSPPAWARASRTYT